MLALVLRYAKLAVLLLAAVSLAKADVVGFTGLYDPSLWSLSGPGSVNSAGAPASVVVWGSNNPSGNTVWQIAAPATGTVSLSWSYHTDDFGGAFWDPAGWVLNGGYHQLSNSGGAINQSGSTSFGVSAGDEFGFYVDSDGCCGAASITISSFTAPGDATGVPEPATLLLVGVPLVLAGLRRRRN